MELVMFTGISVLLVLLLSLLGATWDLGDDGNSETEDEYRKQSWAGVEPGVCIRRIFSGEDREFVNRQGSARLRAMYRAERTRVALHWVRRTSREIGEIMRQHRMVARGSLNLKVGSELGLFFRYVEFRILCGMLVVLIRIFGPHALLDMATLAADVSRSIGQVAQEANAHNPVISAGSLGGA